jgi:hypothetical protein
VPTTWAQKHGSTRFPPLEFLLLLDQRHRVVMDRVRNFMAKRSCELFRILYEIEERIDDIYIAAWRSECIRMSFVDQIKLKGVVVSRLSEPRDRVRNRLQLVVQRRSLDDLTLGLQFVENLLPHL